MTMTVVSARIDHYGDATIEVSCEEPFYPHPSDKPMDVRVLVAAPEYGYHMVLAVGHQYKKDGTPGAREVKPAVRLESLPAHVRREFARLGYPEGAEV